MSGKSHDLNDPGPWQEWDFGRSGTIRARQRTPTCRCVCGGTYFLIEEAGRPRSDDWVVVHSMPICESYDRLDVGEYLRLVRKTHGVRPVD